MRIRIVTPVVPRRVEGESKELREERRRQREDERRQLFGLCPGTDVEFVSIEKGPTSVECRYDEMLAIPEIVKRIREAESDGCDAAVVNGFVDLGVRVGRELVDIPVLGPGESSMLIASSLCDRFSIVTMVRSFVPLVERNAMECGMTDKLASIRVIEVPVLELRKDLDSTVSILANEGRKAVEEDGAQAVILGCTGMTGMADKVSERSGITVIDPLPAAVKMAETLVGLGLTQSRLAYMRPPEKDRYL